MLEIDPQANLPLPNNAGTLNLIPDLNAHGFLDVVVSDETAVDFMKLTVIVPQPSGAAVCLSAVLAAAVARPRRRLLG